jgi:hypothetical protein
MELLNTLFTYQFHLLGANRSPVMVIKGSRQWIEQYIPLEEFPDLFGGYILWHAPKEKTVVMPTEGLGVWSNRKASKFRRILRERGAVFNVIEGEGVVQQVAIRSQHWLNEKNALSK